MSFSSKIIPALSLAVLLVAGASAPVYAISRSSHDEATTVQTTSSTSDSHSGSVASTSEPTKNDSVAASKDSAAKNTFEAKAKQEIADMHAKNKERSQAAREQACTEHKQGTEARVRSVSTNVTHFQTKLDAVFSKTQAYVTEKQLSVSNYNSLVAAVTAAKSASASSIATLESLKPSIDCTQTHNAEQVAAFRTAAHDTRDKLKLYVQSLKDLLKAVKTAKHYNTSQNDTGSTH